MPARARDPIVLFVGPTLATSPRAHALTKGCVLRRPARRGDVARLVASAARPGVLAIVDGVFHDALAVGHAEIRDALAAGWRVWGLSSMGAIRAREMSHVGMRGFGRVYARFAAEGDFQDDEVALLHEPTAPYRPVSEPLVHWRAAIDDLIAGGVVCEARGRAVIDDLKGRWYGERTRSRALRALTDGDTEVRGAVERAWRDFYRFRWKTHDLESFLEERPFSPIRRMSPSTAPRNLHRSRVQSPSLLG
jgi:hypothetical protein